VPLNTLFLDHLLKTIYFPVFFEIYQLLVDPLQGHSHQMCTVQMLEHIFDPFRSYVRTTVELLIDVLQDYSKPLQVKQLLSAQAQNLPNVNSPF
jgi:hypothetical protein